MEAARYVSFYSVRLVELGKSFLGINAINVGMHKWYFFTCVIYYNEQNIRKKVQKNFINNYYLFVILISS